MKLSVCPRVLSAVVNQVSDRQLGLWHSSYNKSYAT